MEEITPQERSVLREYFRANAVPTQEQFWQFIEASLNNVEDGITKTRGTALRIRPATSPGSQALELFKTQTGTSLAWTLEVVPQLQGIDRPGLHFYQPGHTGTLYLRESDGAIGMGTLTPNARLQIISTSPDSWRHDEVFGSITLSLGAEGQGKPGSLKLQGSALNDFALVRQASGALMIDSSNGEIYFNRDNGVRQFVGGAQPDTILHIMNGEQQEKIRLHAGGDSYFQGGRVGIGVTSPSAPLHVEGGGEARVEDRASGAMVIGNPDQVHLAVDSDAILAKSSANTTGTLRLQPQGGTTDMGGNVHIAGNLELDRDLTLHEDLIVEAELDVLGAARLHGTSIDGGLNVSGQSMLHGTQVDGLLKVEGDAQLKRTSVNGDLNVIGTSALSNSTINGSLDVSGTVNTNANLNVNGASTLRDVQVHALNQVGGDSHLMNTEVDGNLTVNGQSLQHDTTVNGLLDVNGLSSLSNTQVGGSLDVSGHTALSNTDINGVLNVLAPANLGETHVQGNIHVTGQSHLANTIVNGSLAVTDVSNLQDTVVNGPLSVNGPGNMLNLDVQNALFVHGQATLINAGVSGDLFVDGHTHLHDTEITGQLVVTDHSTLTSAFLNADLEVNGVSRLQALNVNGTLAATSHAQVNGQLNVAGASTLTDALVLGNFENRGSAALDEVQVRLNLNVDGNVDVDATLNVYGQANITSLAVSNQLNVNGTHNTVDLFVQHESILGDAKAGNMEVLSELKVPNLSTLGQVQANQLTVNGPANISNLTANYLTVNDEVFLGATSVAGALNVGGGLNVNTGTALGGQLEVAGDTQIHARLNVNGDTHLNFLNVNSFLQAPSAEFGNLQVLNTATVNSLNVTNSLNINTLLSAQNTNTFFLSAQEATVHNLNVTGLLNYPGMNVNGPANFMHINVDTAINMMQGNFHIEAAAGEMNIGSMQNRNALRIRQDGMVQINMDGSLFPYNNAFFGRSGLITRGRMDVVDGSMEPYDPSYNFPTSSNYRADLVITGHRSRMAIASDIYSSPEPGSTVEFAAIDGPASSAFVFSIEQMRHNNNGPVGWNQNMPGSKLGFYLWHRETEYDGPFGMFPGTNAYERIPFAIDGAKFRVGVGTSNPQTRLDVIGEPNMQSLHMLVLESMPGQLEMEYSGNFNNFPGNDPTGGAMIGFSSESSLGLPVTGLMPLQEGVVNNLFGKVGLVRNANGIPGNMFNMPEPSGIEVNSYYDLPIRMRVNDQTMMLVQKEQLHARVEIGQVNGEPSILKVHGNLEVTGNIIQNGAVQNTSFDEIFVPGTGNDYVPIWYQEVNGDGSLLEVEFFTADPALPCVFEMRSYYYNVLNPSSNAGIMQVQTLHPHGVFVVADATLAPMGYRVVWVKSGRTYRWRSNRPISMYNEVPPPSGSFTPRAQPVTELQSGTGITLQHYLIRQI